MVRVFGVGFVELFLGSVSDVVVGIEEEGGVGKGGLTRRW